MTFTLELFTSVWTAEDVAHGANDPDLTTRRDETFTDRAGILAHLLQAGLTEPSSWPVTGNENHIWFSERSRFIAPGEEHLTRYDVTAHRGPDISDLEWSAIVWDVVAAAGRIHDHLFVYATGREDLPIGVGLRFNGEVRAVLALFAEPLTASLAIGALTLTHALPVYLLPSGEALDIDARAVERLSSRDEAEIIEAVDAVIGELTDDIAREVIPATVGDFTYLHEHVDANEYGGFTDPDQRGDWSTGNVVRVQHHIQIWLQQGRPTITSPFTPARAGATSSHPRGHDQSVVPHSCTNRVTDPPTDPLTDRPTDLAPAEPTHG